MKITLDKNPTILRIGCAVLGLLMFFGLFLPAIKFSSPVSIAEEVYRLTSGGYTDSEDQMMFELIDRIYDSGALQKILKRYSGLKLRSLGSKADGYEDIADYGSVLALTPEEAGTIIASSPKTVTNNVGKIITQFNWYLVCVVNSADADEISVNQKVNISIAGFSQDAVKMTLAAKNEGTGDRVALVFRCNLMDSEIASLRIENVKICLEEYSGYAVDKKALRTVDGETGVYIQLGNLVRFRKVQIVYTDDNIVLAAAKGDNGYLRLYDEIITEGTDLYDGKIID